MKSWIKDLKGQEYSATIEYLKDIFKIKKNIVVLCIGTDRSTGDSLGPYIGTKLSNSRKFKYPIYGTLKDPVHAKNLKQQIDIINKEHNNPFIIAIDACLGNLKRINQICIEDTCISPGAALNKDLPQVGDLSIIGVVNTSGVMEFMVLQNTRLFNVTTIADKIYKILLKCV